jgi:hypothetical protein
VRGRLTDTAAHAIIADATVTVLDIRDSSLVAFSRSGASGQFAVKGLSPGNYRLLVTHIGYRNLNRVFAITDLGKLIDLGELVMVSKASTLEAVTVQNEAPPVVMRGADTIEYNAGSFKTKPDAVVEDLLKKLPGIQVDKDGTIKANGETVKKVLVDGKEFFGNDPKVATKNLPADAVDKVQVFDKKSDQSQFTGFDDGNSQKAINLTIRQDRKHGVFGKLMAGGGADAGGTGAMKLGNPDGATGGSGGGGGNGGAGSGGGGPQLLGPPSDGRFESSVNLNQFAGDRQFSLIGMANNTNKQGFGFQDVLGFGGGPGLPGGGGKLSISISGGGGIGGGLPIQGLKGGSQAITTTVAGGLNFNDDWFGNKKATIHGNYFYNRGQDAIAKNETRRYLTPGNALTQMQGVNGNQLSENQRFGIISDNPLDSFTSIRFNTSFTYQRSHSDNQSLDSSLAQPTGEKLNSGVSLSAADMNGYSWNSSALFRHRFATKGRTLSANLTLGLNGNSGGGSLYSMYRYFEGGVISSGDTLNQVNSQPRHSDNYGANINYTEPLSKKWLLEFYYAFNQSHSSSDKKTFDADASGKYTVPNASLTNDFDNTFTTHQEGVQIRTQRKKFSGTLGLTLQQALQDNRYSYYTGDSAIRLNFFNLMPNANIEYSFNDYQHFIIFYNSRTNQPSIGQLAPVPDNSDPLNIRLGNPGLKQEFSHSVRLRYNFFDPFRQTSFFVFAGFNGIHDKIVNDDEIDSLGVRRTKPVNLDGVYSANGSLSWGMPVRWLKSKLNINTGLSYSRDAGLVNGARNNSNNWDLSQGADLSFVYKELLDISGGFKVEYNDVRYSLQPEQNQHYWTSTWNLDANLYIKGGFSIASDLEYIHRTGLPPGYNISPIVWNAGVAQQLLKNKRLTIRAQVFDILGQNTGFSRNTNQNYIDDMSYRVLSRYWLFSLTYNFRNFAGKAVPGGREMKTDIRIMR